MNLNLKHSGKFYRKAGKKMNSEDLGCLALYKKTRGSTFM